MDSPSSKTRILNQGGSRSRWRHKSLRMAQCSVPRFQHLRRRCVTTGTVPQTVLFLDLFVNPLVAKFHQQQAVRTAGRGPAQGGRARIRLLTAFAQFLSDKCAPGEIRHTLADLIEQRIFGIACGHPLPTTVPKLLLRPRRGGGRDTGPAADALAARERGRSRLAVLRYFGEGEDGTVRYGANSASRRRAPTR